MIRIVDVVFMLTAFTLSCAALATAQENSQKKMLVDPSGTWRWETHGDNGAQKHSLTVQANARDAVTAVYNGSVSDVESIKGTINGARLELEFQIEHPNGLMGVQFVGTVTNNIVKGATTMTTDDRVIQLPWEAKRRLRLADVVGTWKIQVDDDGRATLVIEENDGKYTGKWISNETGELPANDLTIRRDLLHFSTTGQIDESVFVSKFAARPLGNKLKGEIVVTIPNHEFEVDFKGIRTADRADAVESKATN